MILYNYKLRFIIMIKNININVAKHRLSAFTVYLIDNLHLIILFVCIVKSLLGDSRHPM